MESDTSLRAGIAQRLKQAMKARQMSTRAFQMEMDGQGVPGASTGAVYRYLSAEATPAVEFLQAAADVLRVKVEWLTYGSGEPTEVEEELSERERRERTPEPHWAALRESMGSHAQWIGAGGAREALDTALRLARYGATVEGVALDNERTIAAATVVGRYLACGLDHAPVSLNGPPYELDPDDVSDFIVGACQAYKRLIPGGAQARLIRMHRATQTDG
jgi:transcriptional regulator with XRE-family HTH domain